MILEFHRQFSTGTEDLDTDIRDLEVVTDASGSTLYASTGQSGGISVFDLPENGSTPKQMDANAFAGLSPSVDIGDLVLLDINGSEQLVFGDQSNGRLVGYTVQGNGQLGALTETNLPGTNTGVVAMTSATLNNGKTVVYSVNEINGKLETYISSGSGGTTLSAQTGATPSIATTGPVLMRCVEGAEAHCLLVADAGLQGVSSYDMDPKTGKLKLVNSQGFDEGLGINTPTALETISAYGETWVIVGASGSQSLSVMHLDTDGTLTATDHLLDSRDTRFGGVQALEVIEVNGQVLVIAGGNDDGLSLFTLLPGGQLIHRSTLSNAPGLGLDNIADIEAVVTDDEVQVFVAAANTPGIVQLRIIADNPGETLQGKGTLTGGNGDDLILLDGSKAGKLEGRAGDDILVSGYGETDMVGGNGADVFVVRQTDQTIHIKDFEAGRDSLDLSLFALLRSPDQLTVKETGSGAKITFGESVIKVDSKSGKSLSVEDLWPSGFASADRAFYGDLPDIDPGDPKDPPSNDGNSFKGTSDAEYLASTNKDDTVRAGQGDDTVWSADGDDEVYGQKGSDDLSTGLGDDTIWGGDGNDSVLAAFGNDSVYGEKGKDTLWGGDGDDYLNGGLGDDTLGGKFGADTILGKDGNDKVFGGDGNDRIEGGDGDDELWASPDQDTILAGPGNDQIGGGEGRDTLRGEDGNDVIYGGLDDARDKLYGGKGSDSIWPGDGNDLAYGDEGDDEVGGADGRDTVYGGTGNDVIYGGAHNDSLHGDEGRDTIYGGTGADVFVFQAGHDNDQINDFEIGKDVIQIDIQGVDYDDLNIRNKGKDTAIETGEGEILLKRLSASEIDEDTFIFL